MNIGQKTIDKMKEMAGEQLDTYVGKINTAFLKAEDGKLKVTISFDIAVSNIKPDSVDLDATISFTADKVKDKVSSLVTENQIELPLMKAVDNLRPKAGSGIDSVTLSSGDKSVTLKAK